MDYIEIMGAKTHNLRNISLKIPKNKLVVVTGVSGSGKSSLIMDTLYNYSKRMYLEALSSSNIYSNQECKVDCINGTQAPVALEQTVGRYSNPRSTVGTLLGLEGYFRVLYSVLGKPVCPECGKDVLTEYCESCRIYTGKLAPQNFSCNHKDGMCLHCNGLGKKLNFSEERIIPDKAKTLTWIWNKAIPHTFATPGNRKVFEMLCKSEGVLMDTAFADLTESFQKKFFYGDDKTFTVKLKKVTNYLQHTGVINYLTEQYKKTSSQSRQQAVEAYLDDLTCPDCRGGKLRGDSLSVRIMGKNFYDIQNLSFDELHFFLKSIVIDGKLTDVLKKTMDAIFDKIQKISRLGLGYLSMIRGTGTLSSGELQKLLLSKHVCSDLTGVMYLLDEPTIGMHEHDTENLLDILKELKEKGNSVIVIEHDDNIIRNADHVIEIGPGAGKNGGKLVAQGSYEELKGNPRSSLFCGTQTVPTYFRSGNEATHFIHINGLNRYNLKNVAVSFPANSLITVTGVAGAGKSTLVKQIFSRLTGLNGHNTARDETFKKIIYIDQKPIGISPRSNIATYLDIFTPIRELFAAQEEAVKQHLDTAAFSLNMPGGRCEKCKGSGFLEVDMYFMSAEYVSCDECSGRRFNKNILQVKYREFTINDILNLTVDEALDAFKPLKESKIVSTLNLLEKFGLGYLSLGQTTETLSGGEAQRVKLLAELISKSKIPSLFLFDEPTTGLHRYDVAKLIELLKGLISIGHTVIAIEHNPDIILNADFVIDMGPGSGNQGGTVVFSGTPEELVKSEASITGKCFQSSFYPVKVC
ncbi:MAG: excinuclease ABC subunit UvrA [Ferruginibacter sp.]